ncbi:LysR family transcriptional regulator [Acetobacteraceae bacterium H6797]|nr:LysR family transcriptional regulator [Acetobacteraceae bacterium H6797]
MTFEQLSIFVAVAEREHLTRAAAAIGLTPSAVSAAIRNLEAEYSVSLFNRVGRRIELTPAGRSFLGEARATLARARQAELVLSEMGGLQRGELAVAASQTTAAYWLPPVLMRFRESYGGIELSLTVGNTRQVAERVVEGLAEVGFIEGEIDVPALSVRDMAEDALIVVVAPGHPWADGRKVSTEELATGTRWVMREDGSGTRSAFENEVRNRGVDPARLDVALVLPSNEAVLSAVRAGRCATAISRLAAMPLLGQRLLVQAGAEPVRRTFRLLSHQERPLSRAAEELARLCRS